MWPKSSCHGQTSKGNIRNCILRNAKWRLDTNINIKVTNLNKNRNMSYSVHVLFSVTSNCGKAHQCKLQNASPGSVFLVNLDINTYTFQFVCDYLGTRRDNLGIKKGRLGTVLTPSFPKSAILCQANLRQVGTPGMVMESSWFPPFCLEMHFTHIIVN